jgi:hypothetical protein
VESLNGLSCAGSVNTLYCLPWGRHQFIIIGHPLWQEDECVIYSCCYASPVQSLLGLSPMGHMTIFCLNFQTPPTWRLLAVAGCDIALSQIKQKTQSLFITIKLLDFVHRTDFYKQKTQRFGNWIHFRLQARGGHLLYRNTKSLPFHRRCQNKRRSTTGNKGTINTWPQEESMGCNKRIWNEKFGGREKREQ